MPSLNIEEFSGASIVTASTLSTNIVYDNYPAGIVYATQRPSVNTIEDASEQGVGEKGRGIHYWAAQDKLYIVNDNKVYIDSYSGGTSLTITTGTNKCYFTEVGIYLMLIDPENNQGWVIAAEDVILEMTGASNWAAVAGNPAYDFTYFPTNLSYSLAEGTTTLDGTGYVLSTNGEIAGSDIETPLQWDVANVITSEKEPDIGVFIGKVHDNIVILNTKTIEYFWDAGNTTGSPLSPRDDMSFNIGCSDGKSVWIESDIVYFTGLSNSGEIGTYKISNFTPAKISKPPTDSYLTTAKVIDNISILGSGFSSGGRTYFICTLYESGTTITPRDTLVYNLRSDTWTLWEHSYSEIDQFPLVAFTVSTSTSSSVSGKGILSNGDYISILDDFNPQDATNALVYVEGLLTATGTADISFNNATSVITSTTTDLSSFSNGDQFDVTNATDAGNNTSYIVSGTPTTTSITTGTAPATTRTNDANAVTLTRDAYVVSGYVSSTGASGTVIPFTIRVGHLDFGTRLKKRGHKLRYVGDKTKLEQTLTITWSKEDHGSFNTGRTLNLNNPNSLITRIGSFSSITFEINGAFTEQIRMEGLEFEMSKNNK